MNIQLAAHRRPRPVSADAPACPDADQSGGPVEQRDDPGMGLAGVIDQVDQPVPPEHSGTRRRQCAGQELLIGALLEDLDAREPGLALLQIRDADPSRRRVCADLHPQCRVGAG
jgi:hypothetical protein